MKRIVAVVSNVSVTSCSLHVMVDEDSSVGNLFGFEGRSREYFAMPSPLSLRRCLST
jgi:hypothetical protein